MARSRSKRLSVELVSLARKLKKVQAAARKLGLFVEDRELLTCPRCGLEEDVAFDGRLFVTVPGNRRCDTGLRFARVTKRGEWWRCPKCGSVLKESVNDLGESPDSASKINKRRKRETTLEEWLAEEMRDPEFRRLYKAAGDEIKAREKLAALGGSEPKMRAPRRRRLR
jgi:uncharacterized C2H2 Zn-finger protein